MIHPEQFEYFLYLPEPRRRMNEIVEDLCAGISVICTLPDPINPNDLCSVIAEKCRKNGLGCDKIENDDCEILPEHYIAQACGMMFSPGEQICVEQIFDDDRIQDVLIINLSELSPVIVKQWTRLLRQWSGYARTYQARTGNYPRALMLVTNQVELSRNIKDDVYLKRYYFWGWISTMELLLVARSVVGEQGLTLEERLWVESVFVELAGTNPELFFWLFEHCRFSDISNTREEMIQQLCELLTIFCEEKGWNRDLINTCCDIRGNNGCGNNGFVTGRPLVPPIEFDQLWCQGMANWNDGDGVFINSAVLALQGDISTLEHRIWRGQTRVLFPVFDRVRKEICDHLNSNFKQEWVDFCETNKNPYLPCDVFCRNGIAEYSVINDFFRLNESKSRVLRDLRRYVDKLRRARNKLAHYDFLSWVQFSQIIKAVKIVERGLKKEPITDGLPESPGRLYHALGKGNAVGKVPVVLY